MRRFAITDIHGCHKTFKALLKEIGFGLNDKLFLLGDYIDRGPESRQVIETIIDLQEQGQDVTCLKGNHEQLMLQARSDRYWYGIWMDNGGEATLKSFGTKNLQEIPAAIFKWLEKLLPHHVERDCILVHAGLNFKAEDPMLDTFRQLWIRDWYDDINYDWLGDRFIVHGHTPQSLASIEHMAKRLPDDQVLNIDGGCVMKSLRASGSLWAVELNSKKLFFKRNID